MKLSRGWSWLLAGFGVWSWVIWPTFIRNIAKDPRSFEGGGPKPFFVVHLVLTVVSLGFGTAIGVLGVRGLARGAGAGAEPGGSRAARLLTRRG